MEFTKMKEDGKYSIKSGMYKGFTIQKQTEGDVCTYIVSTAKPVFERNEKLSMEISKPKGSRLSEEDISDRLTSIIVGDALEDFYDSLPAVPTNFWFKRNLTDILCEEFVKQTKGKNVDYDAKIKTLLSTVDTVKATARPTPYEKPMVEKVH